MPWFLNVHNQFWIFENTSWSYKILWPPWFGWAHQLPISHLRVNALVMLCLNGRCGSRWLFWMFQSKAWVRSAGNTQHMGCGIWGGLQGQNRVHRPVCKRMRSRGRLVVGYIFIYSVWDGTLSDLEAAASFGKWYLVSFAVAHCSENSVCSLALKELLNSADTRVLAYQWANKPPGRPSGCFSARGLATIYRNTGGHFEECLLGTGVSQQLACRRNAIL